MKPIDVPVASVMRNMTMTINVTGVCAWRVRVWLGVRVIRFGAWIIGCGFKVEGASITRTRERRGEHGETTESA